MANLNTKNTGTDDQTLPDISSADVDQAFDRIRTDTGEADEIIELDDADLIDDENDMAIESAEELFRAPGIDDVSFPRTDGSFSKGKLVKWDDPNRFVVVGLDDKKRNLVTKTFAAERLFQVNPFLRNSIAQVQASAEVRGQLTSILQDLKAKQTPETAETKKIQDKEIADGGNAENLSETIRTFDLPGGFEGAAATSMAGYARSEEKDNVNQDRYYVNPETGFVAVIDGMGGGKNGERAAEIVAKNLKTDEADIASAMETASAMMKAEFGEKSKDGACFVGIKPPVIGKPLEVSQCGDADLYHFGTNGSVKFRPGQQLELGAKPQSLFEQLDQMTTMNLPASQVQNILRGMIKKIAGKEDNAAADAISSRIVNGTTPVVETTNPYYASLRAKVSNAIKGDRNDVATYTTKENVEAGDWIVMMSDGVADNFEPGEIAEFMREAIAAGRTPEQATAEMSKKVDERIAARGKNDPDTLKKHYKLDNATVVIMKATGAQGAARAA